MSPKRSRHPICEEAGATGTDPYSQEVPTLGKSTYLPILAHSDTVYIVDTV